MVSCVQIPSLAFLIISWQITPDNIECLKYHTLELMGGAGGRHFFLGHAKTHSPPTCHTTPHLSSNRYIGRAWYIRYHRRGRYHRTRGRVLRTGCRPVSVLHSSSVICRSRGVRDAASSRTVLLSCFYCYHSLILGQCAPIRNTRTIDLITQIVHPFKLQCFRYIVKYNRWSFAN
jgi:hypothetical protein